MLACSVATPICPSLSPTHQALSACCALAAAGDYDTYVRTRAELEENQMKKYKWEQEQIANMKEYIARFGHGSAKLARQAQVRRGAWTRRWLFFV